MSNNIEVSLLGHFKIRRNGKPLDINLRSSQALLAFLIMKTGQVVNREQIAEILWPNGLDAKANLRNSLYHLRTAVGPELIESSNDGLSLNQDAHIDTDVALYINGNQKKLATREIMANLDAHQEEFLLDFYDDWILTERQRINSQKERWFEELIERLRVQKRYKDLIVWAEKWIYLMGPAELAYREMMTAHAQLGNNGKVAEIYQRCNKDLQKEFGLTPSKATIDLYHDLLKKNDIFAPVNSKRQPASDRTSSKILLENGRKLVNGQLVLLGLVATMITLAFSALRIQDVEELWQQVFFSSSLDFQSSGVNHQNLASFDLVPRILRVTDRGTLQVASYDGKEYAEVKVEGLYVMGASWIQQNGQMLVWADPRGDVSNFGQGDFYSIDANGRVVEQLTFTQEIEPKGVPEMTDDGNFILYPTGEAVNILEISTGEISTIVPPDGGLSWVVSANWSQDEKKVVYMRITPACTNCEQTARLLVVDRNGENEEEVFVSEPSQMITLEVGTVGFSADGSMIGFEDLGPKVVPVNGDGIALPATEEIWTWLPSFFPQWKGSK